VLSQPAVNVRAGPSALAAAAVLPQVSAGSSATAAPPVIPLTVMVSAVQVNVGAGPDVVAVVVILPLVPFVGGGVTRGRMYSRQAVTASMSRV